MNQMVKIIIIKM